MLSSHCENEGSPTWSAITIFSLRLAATCSTMPTHLFAMACVPAEYAPTCERFSGVPVHGLGVGADWSCGRGQG